MSLEWGDLPGGEENVARRAGELAHYFNNVLTTITGNLALAERHAAGNPRLLRLLGNIRLAGDRGMVLANALLELAHARGLSAGGMSEEMAALIPPETPCAGRILVVDDDPLVAAQADMALRGMGHEVFLESDPSAALARLMAGEMFDLVVAEIALGGLVLAETVAAQGRVLLTTQSAAAAVAQDAMRFPVLPKPFSAGELARRVGEILPPVV